MMLLVSLRWIIFASLTSTAPAGLIWLMDYNWDEPIRVHVAKGVGCVNIAGTPACETEQLWEQDWVRVPVENCDSNIQECYLTVTIDFGFNPFVTAARSRPNYSRKFTLQGITHDARFRVLNNRYCLHAESDPSIEKCSDPSDIYRGPDTVNPYVGFQGTKPPYQESPGLSISGSNPEDDPSLYRISNINGINLASNAESQSSNGVSEGLTTSISNGVSLTSNVENNLNGILWTSNIGLQTPGTNNEPVPDDIYGILSNDELVVPAT